MNFPDDPIGWAQKFEWLINTAKKIGDKLVAKKAKRLPGHDVELDMAGVYLAEKRGVVAIVGLGNWSEKPDTVKHFSLDIDGHVLAPGYPGSLDVDGLEWWHGWQARKVRVQGGDFERGALFFPASPEVHEYLASGPVHATFTAVMFRNGALRQALTLDGRETTPGRLPQT